MKRLLIAIGISALLVACGDSEMVTKANNGDPQAQFDLAMAYREGKDIQKDLQSSFKWLKESANGGHVEAQYELAKDYAVEAEGNRETSRLGIQQSDDKAREWAEKAKANGNKDSEKLLADISAGNRPDTGFGEVRGNPHGGTSVSGKGN